jgi:hypothetical protein
MPSIFLFAGMARSYIIYNHLNKPFKLFFNSS